MTVKHKKQEILGLIARVNAPSRAAPQAPEDRIAARRSELATARHRRRELEAEFLDTRFLDAYRALAERIENLERIATKEGASSAPKAPATTDDELGPEVSLSGSIREGVLADVLQLLSSNLATGVFAVVSGSARLELYFVEGEIVHATTEGASGESAVFAALALGSGRFYFRETTEVPAQRSIGSKTQFLILEALRQVDEARAQEGSRSLQEPKP